jgi:hypothetical protein
MVRKRGWLGFTAVMLLGGLVVPASSSASSFLTPVVECVVAGEGDAFTAWFGYNNTSNKTLTVPVGNGNKFDPEPRDRGQPRTFARGRHQFVVSAFSSGESLTWFVSGETATANLDSPPCSGPVTPLACDETGGANSATSGGEGSPLGTLTLQVDGTCTPQAVLFRTELAGERQIVEVIKDAIAGNTFTLDVTWEPEEAAYPILPTTIDYDLDGPQPEHNIKWCVSGPTPPSGETWCLLESNASLLVPGETVRVFERYFGQGDPRWAR